MSKEAAWAVGATPPHRRVHPRLRLKTQGDQSVMVDGACGSWSDAYLANENYRLLDVLYG